MGLMSDKFAVVMYNQIVEKNVSPDEYHKA
jgi:hypothetical protein